jgi:hypothetical protein
MVVSSHEQVVEKIVFLRLLKGSMGEGLLSHESDWCFSTTCS